MTSGRTATNIASLDPCQTALFSSATPFEQSPCRALISWASRRSNLTVPLMNSRWWAVFSGTGVVLCTASAAPAPDFVREVRPLLEAHCVKCHGPEKQKGGLRFDTKAGAFNTAESGEKAILPGRASQSRLIKLVSSKKDDERMP